MYSTKILCGSMFLNETYVIENIRYFIFLITFIRNQIQNELNFVILRFK